MKLPASLIAHFFSLSFLLFLAPPALAQSVPGWILEQEQPHTGIWTIYLTKIGMAACNKKLACTLLTKTPSWNIIMFNDRTKVYFMSSLNQWKGSSLKSQRFHSVPNISSSNSILVEKVPRKIKEGKILGFKATKYLTDNLASTGLKKVEFWITKEIRGPQELKQVFSKLYGVGLSKLEGLPLQVSYIDENGKHTPVFTTNKVKAAQIPLKIFNYPTNYKRVESEIAVLMDERGRESMTSIMDDLDAQESGEDIDDLLSPGRKARTTYKSTYSGYKEGSIEEELLGTTGTSSSSASAKSKPTGNWFIDTWQTICDWFKALTQ